MASLCVATANLVGLLSGCLEIGARMRAQQFLGRTSGFWRGGLLVLPRATSRNHGTTPLGSIAKVLCVPAGVAGDGHDHVAATPARARIGLARGSLASPLPYHIFLFVLRAWHLYGLFFGLFSHLFFQFFQAQEFCSLTRSSWHTLARFVIWPGNRDSLDRPAKKRSARTPSTSRLVFWLSRSIPGARNKIRFAFPIWTLLPLAFFSSKGNRRCHNLFCQHISRDLDGLLFARFLRENPSSAPPSSCRLPGAQLTPSTSSEGKAWHRTSARVSSGAQQIFQRHFLLTHDL